MHSAALWYLRRLAVVIMMAATAAFTFQGAFIATSEAVTGDAGHYHHGFVPNHLSKAVSADSLVRAHVHTDGTVHRHAVDDSDAAFDDHLNEAGCPCCWNMAIAVGVLPSVNFLASTLVRGSKLAIKVPDRHCPADPIRLKRPPRPTSIA